MLVVANGFYGFLETFLQHLWLFGITNAVEITVILVQVVQDAALKDLNFYDSSAKSGDKCVRMAINVCKIFFMTHNQDLFPRFQVFQVLIWIGLFKT